jgi:hypothetical protein
VNFEGIEKYTTGRKFSAPWVVIQYLSYVKSD